MKIIDRIDETYKTEPINIHIKSVNFAKLLIALAFVALGLFPVMILRKSFLVLIVLGLLAGVCFFCELLLAKGKFTLACNFFFIWLGVLPFLLMLSQESINYRDMYLYYYFCAPFLVLTAIAACLPYQIWLVFSIQSAMSFLYSFMFVVKIPGILMANIIFSLIIGIVILGLITVFLMISFNAEKKIIRSLEANNVTTKERLETVNRILLSTQETLDSSKTISATLIKQTDGIKDATSSVESINNIVHSISSAAGVRSRSVQELVTEVDKSKKLLESNDQAISTLENSFSQVADVTTVIDSIAAKTNLLAINASIEASHAGDFGKSFAVVASEIRELAEKTNINANKIREILEENNMNIQTVLTTSQETFKGFDSIKQHTEEVKDALMGIIDDSAQVASNVQGVTNTISNLEDMYKQTAVSMESLIQTIDETQSEFASLEQEDSAE